MINPFSKDFDELFNQILTDWKNQYPEADISQGSLTFITSACLASALWGIHKGIEYTGDQIFPDTASSENLDHHAWVRGLTRTYNESDAAYLARLLTYIRRPPAGGNKYDYERWAAEIDNVAAAYCYPLALGLGTVDVVILANVTNTGSETPSDYGTLSGANTSVAADKLMDSGATFQTDGVKKGDVVKNTTQSTETTVVSVDGEDELTLAEDIFAATPENYEIDSLTQTVWDYITDLMPAEMHPTNLRVLPPTIVTQNVTMAATGDADEVQIAADIEAYMNALEPDQTLYRSQLIAIAIQNGSTNVTITVPATDIVPGTHEMLRPGTITVT